MAGGANVGQKLELEIGLDHGLQLEAVGAVRRVAEDEGDGVALAHVAAGDVDGQRLPARPRTRAARRVDDGEGGAVAGGGADVVVRRRVGGLQPSGIAHGAEDDADRARIVETEAPDRVGQREGLVAADLELPLRRQVDMAVENRVGARLDGGPTLADIV